MVVGFGAVAPGGRVEERLPWMWRDDAADVMAPLAAAIREGGAVPGLQLGHGGRQASRRLTGEQPVAPSAVRRTRTSARRRTPSRSTRSPR